ncbi:PLD nuclease N-terminal domain-containing protein [Cohnella sp. AR92]|uniref:PLD nuclease N-terminal domain-containing protein n=1 Tax=Cohnella sp. AR92 TaxID=648716 RepID=UPI000F8EAF9A|nr:PLD nuclease N-terminal domain-containing protein [Cohnella sp. AR92]RUS47325.1 PLDc_N domain-containing protein [Cohnella sp. AR92]
MDHLTNTQLISLIVPLAILQAILMITALVVLVKAERTRGPKWLWALIIVFFSLFGSISFFLFGRRLN